MDIAARYRVKRIMVKPGSKLSMQKHFHRSEHWIVVHGTAEVSVHDDVRTIHENESVYIPIGSVHRLSNPGKILSGGQLVKMISCGSMMVAAGCNCFAGRSNSSPSYYTRCASAFTGLSAAIAIVTRDLFLSVPPRAS